MKAAQRRGKWDDRSEQLVREGLSEELTLSHNSVE